MHFQAGSDHHIRRGQVSVNVVAFVHQCEVLCDFLDHDFDGWVTKIAKFANEILESQRCIAHVLHVDLPVVRVYQVDGGRQHTRLSHSVHGFDLLEHPALREFLIKNGHSVLLFESFLHDALLAPEVRLEQSALGSLRNDALLLALRKQGILLESRIEVLRLDDFVVVLGALGPCI